MRDGGSLLASIAHAGTTRTNGGTDTESDGCTDTESDGQPVPDRASIS